MTLDLDELTSDWDCPPGELRARLVVGRDGEDVIQLRIDLGVMQMLTAGRPDGQRYRGFPTAREYIEHELRVSEPGLQRADWQELQRELMQTNYRRLAQAALAEEALTVNDTAAVARFINGALGDIETCVHVAKLLADHGHADRNSASMQPLLLFDRARLVAQLRVVEGRFEEAIEHAESGAGSLEQLLTELGYDEEAREDDPGLRYLRDLSRQLRLEYGITQTLRERLQEALDREDFETAAEIRDLMRKRNDPMPPSEDEPAAS